MRQGPPEAERRRKRQKGALMAGLMAMIAVSLIWSAVAFQAWIDVLRRDNEAEMIFRGQEIARAIQRYRKDHGGQGPRKLEELLDPSPRRSYYIRKLYADPLVPDGKWGLLFMGPGGQIIDPSQQPLESGLPGTGAGPGGLGNTPLDGSSTGQSLTGQQSPTNAGQLGGVGNRNPGGEQETGLPIAGVKSLCKEQPFRIYKGEEDYSNWLFTYLDIAASGTSAGKGKGKGKGRQGRPGGRFRDATGQTRDDPRNR